MSSRPAYRRLDVDERRRRLLEHGERLFAEHDYGELTMATIAKQAGVSKPLLYHYFPTKRDFFLATLAQGAEQLVERVQPQADALAARNALDAYLSWVDERPRGFRRLLTVASGEPGVRELIDGIREGTVELLLELLGHPDATTAPPALHAALHGWLRFVDGAILVRLDRGAPTREQLTEQLLATLAGAIGATGDATAIARVEAVVGER